MKFNFFFGLFFLFAGNALAVDKVVDFDGNTEIKPLEKELSAYEAEQENSTDLNNIDDGKPLPEILCTDKKLKKQVENFIYAYVNKESTGSIVEQRARYLLARNLHEFKETDENNLSAQDVYSVSSAVAYLKINEGREIYKICHSSGNNTKKFADLFAVIYRDGAYYKVVIPNIMVSTKKINNATFTYSW